MKFLRALILLLPAASCFANIKIINNSTASFVPDIKFISESGAMYQCNKNIPLLSQGDEPVAIDEECYTWGEESATLLQIVGVQPNEPNQVAYCPEFDPPYSKDDNIVIIFQGVDPEKPQPANGICEVKHYQH